jgi:hypothetical protein
VWSDGVPLRRAGVVIADRYRGTVITVPYATEGHRGWKNIDTQILSTGLEKFVEKRGKNKE